MKRIFSIFVSSVQEELAAERRAVKDYITRDPMLGRFFPDVFLFEDLPARDQRPDGRYIGEIDRRDIYLGIFGLTYGAKDLDGLSPTAREFKHATHQAHIQPERIIFIKGLDDSDREPEMSKLIADAGAQLTRRRLIDIPSLLREIYNSLVDFLDERHLLRTPPFDSAPCLGATLNDISAANVREFLRLAEENGRFQPVGPRTPAHVLRHFHLLADGQPTQASIFLFGDRPTQFLRQTQLQCLQFEGTEKRKPIADQRAFEGSVFETIDAARQFVLAKLTTRVGLAAAGASAPVQPEIPTFVIREAIVNAVAHRDYTSDGFVQVIVFSDRVEIWNPGRLPAGLSEDDLRHPHGPLPRNPLLAEPLYRAGYAEKAGSGTTDMIDACRDAGVPEPTFKQHGPHFVVTLWRDWLTDDLLAGLGLNERQLKALPAIRRQPRFANSDYQAATDQPRHRQARSRGPDREGTDRAERKRPRRLLRVCPQTAQQWLKWPTEAGVINGSPMAQMAQAIRWIMEPPAPPRRQTARPAHPACETGSRDTGQESPRFHASGGDAMKAPPLKPAELELVRSVFRMHPEVTSATLFGSRAKGTHTHRSDVDLVVAGDIEPLRAEAISAELEELPLPYRFDVQSLAHIQHRPLLEHIQRVGIRIYPAS